MSDATPERGARIGVHARKWSSDKRKRAPSDASSLSPHPPRVTVRVVSYNILADANAQAFAGALYRVARHRLDWGNRSRAIVEELRCLLGDIVCLQEFEDRAGEVSKRLGESGYAAGASARRSENATGESKRDSCAIFYRREVFVEEIREEVRFSDWNLGDNVACVSVLRHRERAKSRLVVANAHLIFNPKRGDLKVGQCRQLLEIVGRVKGELIASGLEVHSVLAGDWNFNPESPLYEFLFAGTIDLSLVNRRELSGALVDGDGSDDEACDTDALTMTAAGSELVSEAETVAVNAMRRGWNAESLALALGDKAIPFPSRTGVEIEVTKHTSRECDVAQIQEMMRLTPGGLTVCHAFDGELLSAYRTVEGREPEFTTCHAKFVGTNDYIWYTPGIEPIRVLRCPSLEEVLQHRRLPSVRHASDHISMVVDFIF